MGQLPKNWKSLKKFNSVQETKKDLFDLTIEAPIVGDLNKPYIENLKLLNQPKTKTYECYNIKTKEKRQDNIQRLWQTTFK